MIRSLASRPAAAIFLSAVAPLVIRALLSPWIPAPEPAVPDEFSYLLMADTFASGRLANPTHPMWVHFETIFVLHQPTYSSVYPVAQGALLAAGRLMLGDPWFGVCIAIAIMSGAICWMLQGWLPARWALAGSLFAALQLGPASYWMNSFWGGAHAASGGALVLGALPRMARGRWRDAIALAIGLAILANSRPWEGLFLGVAALGFLVSRRVSWRRFVGWPAAILAVNLAAMGFYFSRVTGRFWKLPQQEYVEQYGASATFLWQDQPPVPAYRHSTLEDFFVAQRAEALEYRTPPGAARAAMVRLRAMGAFYLGPLLFLPIPGVLLLRRCRKTRFLAIAGGAVIVAVSLAAYYQNHYAAPAAGAFVALAIQPLRYLNALRRRRRIAATLILGLVAPVLIWNFYQQASGAMRAPGGPRRSAVEARLRDAGGQHLVFVRYGAMRDIATEWVYNAAGIDAAPIVWARDMGPQRNRELIAYYPSRRVWMASPQQSPPLAPYAEAAPDVR